ncbi:MAG: hypothetical protein U1E16_04530 [Hyphomicrobiales bacterium]
MNQRQPRPHEQRCIEVEAQRQVAVMRMAMPFLTALSLKAPMAWVTNSGRKARDLRIANWLCASRPLSRRSSWA